MVFMKKMGVFRAKRDHHGNIAFRPVGEFENEFRIARPHNASITTMDSTLEYSRYSTIHMM